MNPWWVPPIVAGAFAAVMLLRLAVLWFLTR
jgi:hypothetical protein